MRPLETLPIPAVVISGLAKYGYRMCEDLFEGNGDLAPKVLEILESHGYGGGFIEDMLNPPPSISAAQALVLESLGETIPSFSEALDEILGGGVALGKLIQVCGSPGSGKTQFVLQLCVDVQIPNVIEGLEGEAVIIDTECSFTVSRFREIADGVVRHCRRLAEANNITESIENFTVDSVLNGVHYTSATSFEKFTSLVHCLKSFLETHPRVKLIVIDSFVFPFLSMTNTLERTRRACVIINKLCDLARKHLIAVVLTNDLTTRFVGSSKSLCPALGDSITHRIQQTLLLAKMDSNHSAIMYKSNYLPEHLVNFSITREGIRDLN